MENAVFQIDELSGKHTAKLVKQTLGALPGITAVNLKPDLNHVEVDFDSTGVSYQKIKAQLVETGLGVTPQSSSAREKPVKEDHGKHHKKDQQTLAGDNPNQSHNTKKEAQGPNTKR